MLDPILRIYDINADVIKMIYDIILNMCIAETEIFFNLSPSYFTPLLNDALMITLQIPWILTIMQNNSPDFHGL